MAGLLFLVMGDHMSNLQLHPMMVHFPLALTLTGFICLLASRLLQNKASYAGSLAVCGSWNLAIGGFMGLLTLGTGLGAAWHLRLHDGAQYSLSRHVIWAVCTSQLVLVLGLWRMLAPSADERPSRFFLVLATIACIGFIVTGYYGGENVYHYAMGVRGR
jgi:uncharacterized membrane protein